MPPGELICPVSGELVDGRDDLKVHLHVNHRKSLLVDTLLDAVSNTSICPINGEPIADIDDMKAHLHVNHRKSEIVDALLEAVLEGNEDDEQPEQHEPLTA
jgi:hypothetical protein